MPNCEYTEEIVCPYCGHQYSDSWDYGVTESGGDKMECEDCGEEFYAQMNVSVDYSTSCVEHDFQDDSTPNYPDCEKCSRCGDLKFTRYDTPPTKAPGKAVTKE